MGSVMCCKSGETTLSKDNENSVLEVSSDQFQQPKDSDQSPDIETTKPNINDKSLNLLEVSSDVPSTKTSGVQGPETIAAKCMEVLNHLTDTEMEAERLRQKGKRLKRLLKQSDPILLNKSLVYIGQLDQNNMKTGYGLLYTELYIYEGNWELDLMSGNGMLIKDNLEVYKGTFKQGQITSGTLSKGEEYLYTGAFKDFLQAGQAEERRADGSVYIGGFEGGLHHGSGTLKSKDGSVFKGTFKRGHRAEGACNLANGSVYTGSWKNNKMHGTGKLMMVDGSVFKGEFIDGKMHGKGQILKTNGEIIQGYWSEGEFRKEDYSLDVAGRIRRL